MKIRNFLKWYLLISSLYLIVDGLVHILNFKLMDISSWPQPAFVYAKFIGNLYGEMAMVVGLFGVEVSRNLEKYKNILYITAVWGLFYGGYLIYSSLTVNFTEVFSSFPSLYFWIPFYNVYLLFEASLLAVLSGLIFLWFQAKNK